MSSRDPFQSLDDFEQSVLDKIVARLEFRGRDPLFSQWRDAYLNQLDLANAKHLLDVGCGTGVVSRAIANRSDFSGTITGSDPSNAMLDAARRLTRENGLGDRIDFRHDGPISLSYPDGTFDRVIAHTVISHATEPVAILREMARVLAPGGSMAIFDGDYASWTFYHPDAAFGAFMENSLIRAVVTNPTILRTLPALLPKSNLKQIETTGWVYAEFGSSSFFQNAIETFAPWMVHGETATQEQVDRWVGYQQEALRRNEFFGAGNYYAFIATKP